MLGVGRTYVRTCIVPGGVVVFITVRALDLFINLSINLSLSFRHYQHTHTNTTLLATGAFLSSGSGEKVRKRGRYPCVAQHVLFIPFTKLEDDVSNEMLECVSVGVSVLSMVCFDTVIDGGL